MRHLPALGLALFAAIHSVAASAQHPMVLDKLRELDALAPQPGIEELRAALEVTARKFGEANGTCIPEQVLVGDVSPVTGARDVLGAVLAGQVRNGWTVYATHRGCPGDPTFRYMVLQKSDGSLLAPIVNEGRSYANPSIMRDTSAQAGAMAWQKVRAVDPNCAGDGLAMGPTKVVGQSEDLGPEVFGVRYVGSWSEVWRFNVCGRAVDVPVEFRADGDGGAYTEIKAEQAIIGE